MGGALGSDSRDGRRGGDSWPAIALEKFVLYPRGNHGVRERWLGVSGEVIFVVWFTYGFFKITF